MFEDQELTFGCRDGLAEQVALHMIAVLASEQEALLFSFNSLSDNV